MAKGGSMRDRAARAAAGHGSAVADVDLDGDEGEAPQRGTRKKNATDDRGGRKLTARQKAIVDRDAEVLDDGEEGGVLNPDDDTGATEDDRRRSAKKPRRDARTQETFFEYRGKRFASEEELEDYLDDMEADRRRATREPAPRETKQKQEPPAIPWDKLIEDTPGVMKQFADSLLQSIRNELIPAYQADRDMQNFWRDFYGENPELGKPRLKMLVESIFMSSQDKIGDLPLDRARARLARIVKSEFREMGIPLQGGGGFSDDDVEEQPRRQSRTRVEGSEGGGTPRRRERREEEEPRQSNGNPVTLSSVLRARAARRRGEDTSTFFK